MQLFQKQKINFYYCLVILFFMLGCSTSENRIKTFKGPDKERQETSKDVESALKSVLGSISQEEVDDRDLKDLVNKIRKDKDARSAVEAIADSMDGSDVQIRYCPVCGKRYSPKFNECPEHKVPLEILEE